MISDHTLRYYQKNMPTAEVERCNCKLEEFDGEHLRMLDNLIFICFYPDPTTGQITVLHMGSNT